ncbi:hypothetical protein [uncultured Lactobacillus sp.]|uniref:hypothetical protein n=1 Tax=uncultured Lactobacillus sp. TaxID=153152 RepID=UPI0027297D42|nr:hypothetical protein [uncultured Lactobacillus sp.]
MADVFEKEGSPTQDATYREHLDRNWEAGNRKFAELEGKVKNTEEKCQDIIGDQDSNDVDKKKKEERIKALETQVAKLSLAVFGDGATAVHTISSNEDNHSQIAEEVKLD